MTGNPTILKGRAWVIRDADGRRIDDIDTDMIYHNAHLAVTEIGKMGRHTFGNLDGWKDFPDNARPGDIVIAGRNFGCGSSRQHAVDCFRALGVSALVVESAGAIYFRNAVNSGFPLLLADGVVDSPIQNGDEIEVDLSTGEIRCPVRNCVVRGVPFSEVQMDIYKAGSLFNVRPK
ncbi:MAG: 3-isopropylmalate dehydratase small subunit [Planctomycetota bacterium]